MPRRSASQRAVARRPCRPSLRWQRAFPPDRSENVSAQQRQKFHTSPAKFLAYRCKSSFPPSSARTSSARRGRVRRNSSNRSNDQPDSNSQLERGARRSACGKCRPACRIEPAAFHRFPKISETQRSRDNTSNFAPLFPVRRTRSNLPASRQLPDRGCSSASAWPLPAASPCRTACYRVAREPADTRSSLLSQPSTSETSKDILAHQSREFCTPQEKLDAAAL